MRGPRCRPALRTEVVEMLTTAGSSFSAKSAKDSGGLLACAALPRSSVTAAVRATSQAANARGWMMLI